MGDDLNLRFLGTVSVSRSGKPITGFRSRKALALLGYLAVQPQPTPREQLAALFWEDQPEPRGRANLSWVLNRISSLLPGCLHADLSTVALERTPNCRLDIDAFAQLLARGDPAALAEAVGLYRGEFLAGMALDGCAEFEIWLEGERERWRQRVAGALGALVAHYHQRGAHGRALAFARRLLALEPWQERTHRQVMEMLARDGRRDEALVQYETCRRMLAQELGVEPMPETTALYARIRGAPPPRRPRLPPQPAPFIGREEELARVAELLADPGCRLLTILGPGGIGKTRLALQAAAEQAQAFLEGVSFVQLAAVSAPEYLPFAIADALHLVLQDRPTPTAQLLAYLRGKQVLLVLDGLEHLLDARDVLVRILEAAPEVKLLVTSRECLNLRWEWRFELEGLAYPIGDADGAEDLQSYSAARLFQQAARQTAPSFSLAAPGAAVARICRLVGGMPLALELAAAWLGAYSGDEIAGEIERSLDILSTSLQDVPPRHRSMRAAFEQSWRRLSPQEQMTFARLAVFQGSFGTRAAAEVAGASVEGLQALAAKSLLRCLGQGRYEMHELLRQYASEKLAASPGEWTATHDRHSLWLGAFLTEMEGRLGGPDAVEALAAAQAEVGNLRALWAWAATSLNREIIQRGLEGFANFCRFTGPFFEGEALIGVAIEQIRPQLDGEGQTGEDAHLLLCTLLAERARFQNMLGMYEQAVATAQEGSELAARERERALVPMVTSLLQWGEALLAQAELAGARPHLERALALARSGGLRQAEVECLSSLADLCGQQGELKAAGSHGRQALELSRQIGDPWIEAQTLNRLGTVARRQGDHGHARNCHERALSLTRQLGYRRGEALTLVNLGLVSSEQGDGDTARACYEEALQICRQAGSRQGEGDVLGLLGGVCLEQGDPAAAHACHERALLLYREIGDRQGESRALGNLGATAAHQGDYGRAVAHLEQALRLYREVGDRRGGMQILDDLGLVFTCLGAYDRAGPYHEQALAIAREVSDEKAQADVLWHLAVLRRHTRDGRQALEHARQALAIARRLGSPSVEAQALACVGQALEELGELEEAAASHRQALALRRQLGEHNRAAECLAGLARVSLAGGAPAEAGAAAGEILQHLEAHTLEGTLEPCRVYLTCYRALQACRDPRAAAVLAAGRRLLEAQAARIDDAALRRSFLEDVPAHRELRNGVQGS